MARYKDTAEEPRKVYSLRLGDDERRVMEAAAAERGLPLSAYIRREGLRSARRDLSGSTPERSDD